MHIYPWQIVPPAIKHRCLEYCYTKLGTSNGRSIYIEQCTSTYCRLTPQSSIDALNTATPNLAHLMADLYIYRTMHIYLWQIDPHQSSIDGLNTATPNLPHLMADLYIYIEQCTYTYGRLTPLQSSIDALNIATPNLAHLIADL